MSTRDRFLSSLSSAHDQVRSAVDHHLANLQQQQQQQQSGPSNSNSHNSASLHRHGTLPAYASRPNPHAPAVPETVLGAPPGRAQEAYDAMPRSRLENPNVAAHERRKAAEEMRRNQDMLHRSTGASSAYDQGQNVHRRNIQNQPPPLTPQEQRERSLGLKRTHTYASGNGKVLVDLFTLPQKSPTFMGGSADRGRGAMTGQVIVFANDGDRVGAVRLKVKAVSRVSLPRSHFPPGVDPNARSAGPPPSNQPLNLVGRSPKVEPTQAKEHLLLQLEKTLWSHDSQDHSTMTTTMLQQPDGKSDPTTWRSGRHVFDFKVDLPAASKDGTELPPSFVFLADSQASPSTVKQAQISGAVVNAKKWITEAAQGAAGVGGEWASIKWYVKVTIEKPGLFRANERVFAPFVYLPPPPAKLNERVIPRRLKLSQELRQNPQTPAQALVEPASEWESAELDLTGQTHQAQSNKGNRKGKSTANGVSSGGTSSSMWSKIFKGPLVSSGNDAAGRTQWSIALPNRPAIWPLRSILPFELKVQGPAVGQQPGGRPSPPSVGLFLRVTLINSGRSFTSGKNAPMSATETRLISVARLYPDGTSSVPSMGHKSQTWRGLLDFPPEATPCFDSNLIQVEYFVAVQTMPQQPAQNGPGAQSVRPVGRIAWAQKVVLVCPLPTVVRPPPAAAATTRQVDRERDRGTPRTRGAVRRVSSVGRRAGRVAGASVAAGRDQQIPPTQQQQHTRPSIPPRPPIKATSEEQHGRQASSGSTMTPIGSASTRPPNSRRGSSATSSAAHANAAVPSPRTRSRRGSPPAGSDVSAAHSASSSSHRRASGGSRPAAAGAAAATSAYPMEKAVTPTPTVPEESVANPSTPPRGPARNRTASSTTPASSRRSSVAPSEWSYEDDVSEDHNHHLQRDPRRELLDEMDSFGDGDAAMGMDLPPSYFEATGFGERDDE